MHFVLALCPFARESYEEVLRVLTSGIPGSGALARVNRSSLCRARARLGEDVLETVSVAREGRVLPRHVIYRVITFAKGDKVAPLGTTLLDPEQYAARLARSFTEAGREARARLLPARRNRDCPRAIKKPNRWPVLRTRARRGTVQPGRWAHDPTSKPKSTRRAGRPALSG